MVEIFPQPALYTVEAHDRPVVVISAPRDDLSDNKWLLDPTFVMALGGSQKVHDQIRDAYDQAGIDPNKRQEPMDLCEIRDALDIYLGADLRTLEDAVTGQPLWDGDDTNIRVRNATTEEAEAWNHSLRAAVEAGEREAGDASWVSFLVAVRNPTYDAA